MNGRQYGRICLTYVFRSDSQPGLPLPHLSYESSIIMLVTELQRHRFVVGLAPLTDSPINFSQIQGVAEIIVYVGGCPPAVFENYK